MNYVCVRACYGFRKMLWAKDEIAKNVTEDEQIPLEHFVLIGGKDVKEDEIVTDDKPKSKARSKSRGGA